MVGQLLTWNTRCGIAWRSVPSTSKSGASAENSTTATHSRDSATRKCASCSTTQNQRRMLPLLGLQHHPHAISILNHRLYSSMIKYYFAVVLTVSPTHTRHVTARTTTRARGILASCQSWDHGPLYGRSLYVLWSASGVISRADLQQERSL